MKATFNNWLFDIPLIFSHQSFQVVLQHLQQDLCRADLMVTLWLLSVVKLTTWLHADNVTSHPDVSRSSRRSLFLLLAWTKNKALFSWGSPEVLLQPMTIYHHNLRGVEICRNSSHSRVRQMWVWQKVNCPQSQTEDLQQQLTENLLLYCIF